MPSENLRAFSQGIFLYILSKKITSENLRAFSYIYLVKKMPSENLRAFSYISLLSLDVIKGHFLIYP